MSEVMQVEAIGARREPPSRKAARWAYRRIAGLADALERRRIGGRSRQKLSGTQICARFSDRQLTDEVHWREVYQRDGTFRSYSMGKVTNRKMVRSFG